VFMQILSISCLKFAYINVNILKHFLCLYNYFSTNSICFSYVQQQPADTRKSGGDGNAGKCCLVALLACCFGCCLGECCD
jgi:hypothetical protein